MQCYVVSAAVEMENVTRWLLSQLSSLDITCFLTIMAVSHRIAVCDFA